MRWADFISKMNIALKEADESAYWLELLWETEDFAEVLSYPEGFVVG